MRMPEIIPMEPKKKREYDYARECLDEAKETKRRFVHIMIENGAMDRGISTPHPSSCTSGTMGTPYTYGQMRDQCSLRSR